MFVLATDLARVGEYDLSDQPVTRAFDLAYEPDALDKAGIGNLRYAQKNCGKAVSWLESRSLDPIALSMLTGCVVASGDIDQAQKLHGAAATECEITSPADYPPNLQHMPGIPERLTAQFTKADWPFDP